MIAVDTNVLVAAHRRDHPSHRAAAECVRSLAEGVEPWTIPAPCLHEFLAIVTHARIFDPPSRIPEALAQVDAWLASPTLFVAGESDRHWSTLAQLLHGSRVTGAAVHDARIAAICIDHGARTILTADRDFTRFEGLRAENPLE